MYTRVRSNGPFLTAALKALPRHWVCPIATLGPVGFKTKAPGTLGSFLGLFYYTTIFHPLSGLIYGIAMALSIWFSIHICGAAEAHFGQKDPGYVILDEFVAMPLCFLGLGSFLNAVPAWPTLLLGFALFRFYDILKPFGIKRLQRLPGGQGVVYDDVAAALLTCVTLHALLSIPVIQLSVVALSLLGH